MKRKRLSSGHQITSWMSWNSHCRRPTSSFSNAEFNVDTGWYWVVAALPRWEGAVSQLTLPPPTQAASNRKLQEVVTLSISQVFVLLYVEIRGGGSWRCADAQVSAHMAAPTSASTRAFLLHVLNSGLSSVHKQRPASQLKDTGVTHNQKRTKIQIGEKSESLRSYKLFFYLYHSCSRF